MNDYFHFKQFSVNHKRSSMKVGTDGVLLGAWANLEGVKTILDIGTGTGVIALMMAQRTSPYANIDAVELNKEACEDARKNFFNSPWNERLRLHCMAIQDFNPGNKYDLIISNPPYFLNSHKPRDSGRQTARHAKELPFEEFLHSCGRLLNTETGRIAVILPPSEGLIFKQMAENKSLHSIRQANFRTRPGKPVERRLMEFCFTKAIPNVEEILLYLYESGDEWSEAYKTLTKEFYLKL